MASATTNKSILCSSIVILAMLTVAKTAPREEMHPESAYKLEQAPSQICETIEQTDIPIFHNETTGIYSHDSGVNQEPHFTMTRVICAGNGTYNIQNREQAICQQEYVYVGPEGNRLALEVGCSVRLIAFQ